MTNFDFPLVVSPQGPPLQELVSSILRTHRQMLLFALRARLQLTFDRPEGADISYEANGAPSR